MASIKNYFFGEKKSRNEVGRLMDYRNNSGKFCMSGNIYGREGFPDDSKVVTSMISEIKEGVAKTISGTEYQLESINQDYQDFLNAIDSKIPILHNWEIVGTLRRGYQIKGIINGEEKKFDIISQNKSILTVKYDEALKKEIFVDWLSRSESVNANIIIFGELIGCDLNVLKDFTEFCSIKYSMPILFPEKK